MIERVPEVEVMDTAEEASDYDAMDHAEVNRLFCDDFAAFLGPSRAASAIDVLDVGTGTARIPILVASRMTAAKVLGIDLSKEMLILAKTNIEAAGLASRVSLSMEDAKKIKRASGTFGAVICNTIIHHIPGPEEAIAEMLRLLGPGGALFVRDLVRPDSHADVAALVAKHGGEPTSREPKIVASHARQRALFEASLLAGLTLAEMRALVLPLGIPAEKVTMTSDRHWTLAYTKP
jgi:ubiquinone/menaquinone biosynthesis C-methylase UbiE